MPPPNAMAPPRAVAAPSILVKPNVPSLKGFRIIYTIWMPDCYTPLSVSTLASIIVLILASSPSLLWRSYLTSRGEGMWTNEYSREKLDGFLASRPLIYLALIQHFHINHFCNTWLGALAGNLFPPFFFFPDVLAFFKI